MAKQPTPEGIPNRKTGNWSGTQGNKRRPGNEGDQQAGQREYTEPTPEDTNSSDKPG